MRVTTDAMEIRGKEVKTSRAGKDNIIVRAEDDAGKLYELCDHNVSRVDEYQKGRTCRLILDIDMGKYRNISIIGIVES